ncbi:unnamed protein product [Amoebophrya sp. A120]|nr:unnamed protein product [Amoebophrya sp. A120]|eukprot:GSA120T00023703001.1
MVYQPGDESSKPLPKAGFPCYNTFLTTCCVLPFSAIFLLVGLPLLYFLAWLFLDVLLSGLIGLVFFFLHFLFLRACCPPKRPTGDREDVATSASSTTDYNLPRKSKTAENDVTGTTGGAVVIGAPQKAVADVKNRGGENEKTLLSEKDDEQNHDQHQAADVHTKAGALRNPQLPPISPENKNKHEATTSGDHVDHAQHTQKSPQEPARITTRKQVLQAAAILRVGSSPASSSSAPSPSKTATTSRAVYFHETADGTQDAYLLELATVDQVLRALDSSRKSWLWNYLKATKTRLEASLLYGSLGIDNACSSTSSKYLTNPNALKLMRKRKRKLFLAQRTSGAGAGGTNNSKQDHDEDHHRGKNPQSQNNAGGALAVGKNDDRSTVAGDERNSSKVKRNRSKSKEDQPESLPFEQEFDLEKLYHYRIPEPVDILLSQQDRQNGFYHVLLLRLLFTALKTLRLDPLSRLNVRLYRFLTDMTLPSFLFPYYSKLQKASFWMECGFVESAHPCVSDNGITSSIAFAKKLQSGSIADTNDDDNIRQLLSPSTATGTGTGSPTGRAATGNKGTTTKSKPPISTTTTTSVAEAHVRHYWLWSKEEAEKKNFDKKKVYSNLELGKLVIPDPARQKVFLYFHGGAFVFCDADSANTALLAWLVRNCGSDFVALLANFRRPPDFDVECAVEDGLQVYRFLVEELSVPCENIILVGDSAGGQLCVQLLLKLGLLEQDEKDFFSEDEDDQKSLEFCSPREDLVVPEDGILLDGDGDVGGLIDIENSANENASPNINATIAPLTLVQQCKDEPASTKIGAAPKIMMKKQNNKLALPGKAILFSPWADQSANEKKTPSFVSNRQTDMIHPETVKMLASGIARSCNRAFEDPVLSSVYAFQNFLSDRRPQERPPASSTATTGSTISSPQDEVGRKKQVVNKPIEILIQSGETEVLRDIHVELAQLMAKCGLSVDLQIYHEMCHVGQLLYTVHPMGKLALKNAKEFVLRGHQSGGASSREPVAQLSGEQEHDQDADPSNRTAEFVLQQQQKAAIDEDYDYRAALPPVSPVEDRV